MQGRQPLRLGQLLRRVGVEEGIDRFCREGRGSPAEAPGPGIDLVHTLFGQRIAQRGPERHGPESDHRIGLRPARRGHELRILCRQRIREVPHQIARQGIARTFQNIALFKGMSTLDNIMTGRFTHMHRGMAWQALWKGPAEREEIANREKVERIIDFLEIQAIRKTPVGRLPYGLQKRVELGRALAMEPDLLLLDEPMAGMNVEEKEDMSRFILDVNDEFGTTMALIEHDMGVVMDISDRVVVLDYGRKIADGPPGAVRANPDVIKAYLGVSH